ncbi:hypothetical protein OYC64_010284 [Pagothenia borchgrevinki]|uniref:Uncharacterized protein n=1 Tax=Pagothenia borchgrevinki TaxID=8213 RepID=A0ABD2GY14_PAGBO
MASSSASAALRPAGTPSASAASTSAATDSEGAPSASAASTSAATDSEGAPSASAASTSAATDSEGAPSASAASTSVATDSEGAPSASAASTSAATDSEGAPSASAASTSVATDSEGATSASAATETAGSTAAPIPPKTSLSMDADVEGLHSAQWVNAGTPEVFYRRSHLEQPNRNSINDFLIDYSDEEEEGEDEAFGALESDVFPVEEVDLAVLLSDFKKDFVSDGLVSSICIRRKKLLESAIQAISRVTFCWNHSPYIECVGEDGDDMGGGPQREFFSLNNLI